MTASRLQAAGRRPGQALAGGAGTWKRGLIPAGRKRLVALALLVLGTGASVGCEPNDQGGDRWRPDTQAPSVPRGLWSMTGDREIQVMWIANTESDLDGYRVYRSTAPTGYFPRVATVGRRAASFTDREVRNGVTYYYAISSYDDAGNESELTPTTVHDTPRPEGGGLRLDNARLDPRLAGSDFSADRVVSGEETEADIYYWHSPEEGAWMVATERSADDYTDIQDAGYLALDDVDWAPEEGWAPGGEVPLIEGHSYIVWTWDNHFAKFRVASVTADRVVIDWAYQLDEGNPELLRPGSAAPPRPALNGTRAHRVGLPRRNAS
jgi:hypothetical protein